MHALRNESLSSSLCIFFLKARLSSKMAWILKETDSETASLMGQHRFVRAWGYSFRYENKVRVGRERRSVRVDATAWLESKRERGENIFNYAINKNTRGLLNPSCIFVADDSLWTLRHYKRKTFRHAYGFVGDRWNSIDEKIMRDLLRKKWEMDE